MKGGRTGQGIVCYDTFPNPLGIWIFPIKLPLTLSTKVVVVLFFQMVRGSKKERKVWVQKWKKLRCFVEICCNLRIKVLCNFSKERGLVHPFWAMLRFRLFKKKIASLTSFVKMYTNHCLSLTIWARDLCVTYLISHIEEKIAFFITQ